MLRRILKKSSADFQLDNPFKDSNPLSGPTGRLSGCMPGRQVFYAARLKCLIGGGSCGLFLSYDNRTDLCVPWKVER